MAPGIGPFKASVNHCSPRRGPVVVHHWYQSQEAQQHLTAPATSYAVDSAKLDGPFRPLIESFQFHLLIGSCCVREYMYSI